MKTVMLGALVAVLATVLLQHAAPVQQGERIDAASTAASATLARNMKLAAGTNCLIAGTITRGDIERAIGGHQLGSAGSFYANQDFDFRADGIARYNAGTQVISMSAQADGDCAKHGRRLGGMEPWIAYLLGSGYGLAVRLAVLGILLGTNVAALRARPTSEALGGFVGGAMTTYLLQGQYTSKVLIAGAFGAMTSTLGGTASRQIVENLRYMPQQAAAVARGMRGNDPINLAGDYIANMMQAGQAPWAGLVNQWLAAHPR